MGDFYEIYVRADGSAEYTVDDIFEPIPLTEEWLLKFGFEKKNKSFHKYSKGFCHEGFYCGGKWHTIVEGRKNNYFYKGAWMIYVHQLQNLYFALTGQELIINT
jgi:hypothetical protein